MITTRILGKKVTGKNMYQCFVKALGFFPKVDKTTTFTDIGQQVKPKAVNYLIEKLNNKNRS